MGDFDEVIRLRVPDEFIFEEILLEIGIAELVDFDFAVNVLSQPDVLPEFELIGLSLRTTSTCPLASLTFSSSE
jgi:hypothetical protein